MRNILEKVRKRDYDAVKTDAQAIYLAVEITHPPRFYTSSLTSHRSETA